MLFILITLVTIGAHNMISCDYVLLGFTVAPSNDENNNWVLEVNRSYEITVKVYDKGKHEMIIGEVVLVQVMQLLKCLFIVYNLQIIVYCPQCYILHSISHTVFHTTYCTPYYMLYSILHTVLHATNYTPYYILYSKGAPI